MLLVFRAIRKICVSLRCLFVYIERERQREREITNARDRGGFHFLKNSRVLGKVKRNHAPGDEISPKERDARKKPTETCILSSLFFGIIA